MPRFEKREEVEEDADLSDMEALALSLGATVVNR